MNSLTVAVFGLVILFAAYFVYGRKLDRYFAVDAKRPTPAHTKADGVDHVAAHHWTVLFGHHFSSIAGAGPVVGPVIAVALWGWVPAILWVILGTVFLGGVHDFGALVISIRHHGHSVADIAEQVISKRAKLIFSIFVWLSLILIIAVFVYLCADTLVIQPDIVLPSLGLIPIAVLVGFSLYRLKLKQAIVTIFGLLTLAILVILGRKFPIDLAVGGNIIWSSALLVYCYIASITPVQILLQPRDYLSSFLLFAGMFFGYLGIIFSHPRINLEPFVGWSSQGGDLWPMLFVTVACGAISGFHALVASGTTSKQIASERDIRKIGYGAMIVEGVVAIMAVLVVIAGFSSNEALGKILGRAGPIGAFGQGYGEVTKIVLAGYGGSFAVLVLNAFMLTTLDTATRIGRYLTQELFGIKNKHFATSIIVFLSAALALTGKWNKIWPVFGASNQLIAALTLVVITSWLLSRKRKYNFVKIPAIFMLVTAVGALFLQIVKSFKGRDFLLMGISAALIGPALFIILESRTVLFKRFREEKA